MSRPNVEEIIQLMREPSKKDIDLITKAYKFAEKAHEGGERFTGEPYFVHAFETGKNLAIFGMDSSSIAAGLLHDTLEDGNTDKQTLEKESFNFMDVKIFAIIICERPTRSQPYV